MKRNNVFDIYLRSNKNYYKVGSSKIVLVIAITVKYLWFSIYNNIYLTIKHTPFDVNSGTVVLLLLLQ